MFSLEAIQTALTAAGLDGWLLYDFRGSNVLARRVLGMEAMPISSRRFFYMIPASGTPSKLVHRIETGALDHLPGEKHVYLRWQELEAGLATLLQGKSKVAAEYSPRCGNPYVSRIDAGTVDLIRACGAEPVSSGDLIQQFEAVWDDDQWESHRNADEATRAAYDLAWSYIVREIKGKKKITEGMVQALIMDHFAKRGLTTYSPPIVAVNAHSADPHFENDPSTDTVIKKDDYLLIDLWAKMDRPRAVYSDLTRVGFVGTKVPEKIEAVFQIVAKARDAAVQKVKTAFASRTPLHGYEVDQAARDVIDQAGYGAQFIHRTGHSIGQETHGNGANMDNLETRDERLVMKRTAFSIEPGIYLPGEFGVRSEINVYVDGYGQVHVTGGPPQTRVLPLLDIF